MGADTPIEETEQPRTRRGNHEGECVGVDAITGKSVRPLPCGVLHRTLVHKLSRQWHAMSTRAPGESPSCTRWRPRYPAVTQENLKLRPRHCEKHRLLEGSTP